ncbi:MAG: hypothetical protein RL660_429 [Bacteroidota bacterium]
MHYLIDIELFIRQFLPPRWRKSTAFEWLFIQLYHVSALWQMGVDHSAAIQSTISVTLSTESLLTYLQSLYPTVSSKSISIYTPTELLATQFAGYVGEGHSRCYTAYKSEAAAAKYYNQHGYPSEHRFVIDYIVKVPTQYSSSDTAIRAICNKYKPAGKNYQIQYF